MKRSHISIVIVILIPIAALLIVFNSGILIHGSIGNYSVLNQTNTTQNNSISSIPNSTYTGNGLTFNYPSEWRQVEALDNPTRWGNGAVTIAFEDPNDLDTYVYIKHREVNSLDEQVSEYKTEIGEMGQTVLSERYITLNGMRAVELIKTFNGTENKTFKALTVHVEGIPGSLYYRIGCVTLAENFDKNRPKFDVIVNSFKLQ